MTLNDKNQFLESFLKVGGLIRLPSGKLRIWEGPFQAVENTPTAVFSVGFCAYYESELQLFHSDRPVVETEVSEFRAQLRTYIDGHSDKKGTFNQTCFEMPALASFEESFQLIQGKIHRGEVEKAVPVVFARSARVPTELDRARILFHALETHPELFVFGYWNAEGGILGATPEVLFQLQGKKVRTMALAGTCPHADKEMRLPLHQDPKEMREHQLVVQDIQNKLEKLGWVKAEDTEVVDYPTMAHLRTYLEVETSGISAGELIKRMHPTAALGVFPRNYGIRWMKNLPEQADRDLFGAPVVFAISRTEYLGLVAIRCLQWSSEGSKIGAGCGLVEASQLQQEWRELQVKLESVMKTLGLS